MQISNKSTTLQNGGYQYLIEAQEDDGMSANICDKHNKKNEKTPTFNINTT